MSADGRASSDASRGGQVSNLTTLRGRLLAGLPPIVDERSRVLVLGSFPSVQSLAKGEYYGNRLNHFWPIMEALFAIMREWPYERRREGLLDRGIAVWDVIGTCRREGSGDDAIEEETPNDLASLLRAHAGVRHVAFNGTMAWNTARRHVPELFRWPSLHCERLPSTSPKHATKSLKDKIVAWSKLRDWLEQHVAPE